jgi:signal transduction histidine kinase
MRSADAPHRLRQNKDRVMSIWQERLRKQVPAAGQAPAYLLINTLPVILDYLAEALTPGHPRMNSTEGNTAASEHGGERVRLTHFRLEDLITEYQILRQVLVEVLEEEGPLSAEERQILHASLDQTIIEACTGFALVQSTLRDQLFAMVAHDLRNPLSAAQAAANLILHKPTADNVRRWAARIIENIGRVDRMVTDLLDAVRVQSGARLELEIREVDVVELVRDTIEQLQVEHGDRFVLRAPETLRAHIAPEAMRRSIENLATNAVKYGAPARPITLTLEDAHGRCVIRVHNHGAPIPMEQREALFRAFQRADGPHARGQRGWGLGLAQVRAVAEAHGGSINVDSLPDRGTTFTIDVPIDARPFQENPIFPMPAA